MSEYYDDPYSFNYATQFKGPNISSGDKNSKTPPTTKNFNVFNPNKVTKVVEENSNTERKQNFKKGQENNYDELQGNIDLDKNVYDEKTKEFKNDTDDYEEELPLLDELGIYPINIKSKLISIFTFHKVDKKILEDADMAGPLLVLILFGFTLALQTKAHFGYLYGLSIFGSIMIFLLMNLLSKESILFYNTVSVLGYCMTPIVGLSFIALFLQMKSVLGAVCSFLTIILSSHSATQFFEIVLSMREQRWLIFYPVVLFYTCFTLLAIF